VPPEPVQTLTPVLRRRSSGDSRGLLPETLDTVCLVKLSPSGGGTGRSENHVLDIPTRPTLAFSGTPADAP